MSDAAHRTPVIVESPAWLTETLLDPTGRVFSHEGKIYRAIYPQAAARVRKMIESGLVARLVKSGLLVETAISSLQVPGFEVVLQHDRVPFLTASAEWCRTLLRDAARSWLDLNLALLAEGLGTVDAHWGNFGQIGKCQPVWLDFGSIAELEDTEQSIEQFRQFFLNPLRLAALSPALARVTRGVSQTGGITDEEYAALRPAPMASLRKLAQRVAARLTRKRKKKRKGKQPRDLDLRRQILETLRSEINGLELAPLQTTWGDYHPDLLFKKGEALPGPNPRRDSVLRAIDEAQPKRAIDLAGNAGFYSFYAARMGAETLSVDFDEAAVERLYEFARRVEEPLKISCACYDLTRPVYARGMRGRKADLVLALALTHHLSLGQGQTFESIGRLLVGYCTDTLLVEFMPNGLGGTVPKPDPLPAGYTLDRFLDALRAFFRSVEVLADHKEPQWRVLIRCRNPLIGR